VRHHEDRRARGPCPNLVRDVDVASQVTQTEAVLGIDQQTRCGPAGHSLAPFDRRGGAPSDPRARSPAPILFSAFRSAGESPSKVMGADAPAGAPGPARGPARRSSGDRPATPAPPCPVAGSPIVRTGQR